MFSRGARRLPGLLQTDLTLFCRKQSHPALQTLRVRAVSLATRIPRRSRFMSNMADAPKYTNRLADEKSPYLLVG